MLKKSSPDASTAGRSMDSHANDLERLREMLLQSDKAIDRVGFG